ncbi:stress-induced protein [Pseudomonas sp. LB-090624]|uniref:general stress protein n=1 Tax=Pseudomonas TaxID=286 RepID=UPI000D8AE117|nr:MULTISPECIES: KGG domain-containing protein [unclassified Pseudomonas]MCX2887706.1 stress-induced protein [Pseudomonas sp. DCB_BI]MDH4550447.1 stress-induced protein [Pseudomonas sp. BN607]PYB70554.1 stress-induced protein [Pseudomonas sp. LB-090624]
MANDQGQSGQQGGTAQDNPGDFANEPDKASEAGQKGGQMSEGGSGDQRTGHGSGDNLPENDQRAGGTTQRGGQGGHSTGIKSDREAGTEEATQAIQDEDSGMTEDNR